MQIELWCFLEEIQEIKYNFIFGAHQVYWHKQYATFVKKLIAKIELTRITSRLIKKFCLPYWGISILDQEAEKSWKWKKTTCTSMWIKQARLPCWPSRGQQVSHQRWIWGIPCIQAMKHTSRGIHPGFETQADVTISTKQGYQWPHKNDWCPPNIKK